MHATARPRHESTCTERYRQSRYPSRVRESLDGIAHNGWHAQVIITLLVMLLLLLLLYALFTLSCLYMIQHIDEIMEIKSRANGFRSNALAARYIHTSY